MVYVCVSVCVWGGGGTLIVIANVGSRPAVGK